MQIKSALLAAFLVIGAFPAISTAQDREPGDAGDRFDDAAKSAEDAKSVGDLATAYGKATEAAGDLAAGSGSGSSGDNDDGGSDD